MTICPEVDGGLGTPRPAAEIVGPDGAAGVMTRVAFVRTAPGADVTDPFMAGASMALEAARRHGVRIAILKEGSPSCGSSFVHDGSFSGVRKAGAGVTATLLAANGIRVFSEAEIDAAEAWLAKSSTTLGR